MSRLVIVEQTRKWIIRLIIVVIVVRVHERAPRCHYYTSLRRRSCLIGICALWVGPLGGGSACGRRRGAGSFERASCWWGTHEKMLFGNVPRLLSRRVLEYFHVSRITRSTRFPFRAADWIQHRRRSPRA